MSLRFLPFGAFMYLVGGMLFGFGVGFGASGLPGLSAVVITGLGSMSIMTGYFLLKPLFRAAKKEIRAAGGRKDSDKASETGAGAQ